MKFLVLIAAMPIENRDALSIMIIVCLSTVFVISGIIFYKRKFDQYPSSKLFKNDAKFFLNEKKLIGNKASKGT